MNYYGKDHLHKPKKGKGSYDRFQDQLNIAFSFANERERLCKNPPVCPVCNNVQVQLLSWFQEESKWKCRGCGHKFTEVI